MHFFPMGWILRIRYVTKEAIFSDFNSQIIEVEKKF